MTWPTQVNAFSKEIDKDFEIIGEIAVIETIAIGSTHGVGKRDIKIKKVLEE